MFALEKAGCDGELLRQSCLWIAAVLCPSTKVTIHFFLPVLDKNNAWYVLRCPQVCPQVSWTAGSHRASVCNYTQANISALLQANYLNTGCEYRQARGKGTGTCAAASTLLTVHSGPVNDHPDFSRSKNGT